MSPGWGCGVTSKPSYISHSALSQYLRCSWQYKLERIEKIPTPPAWYFIGGKAVHLATQWLDEKDDYPYTDTHLEHLWSQAYDQEIAEAFEEWPQDDEWLTVGRRGAEQGYAYWDARGIAAVKAWHEWRTAPERHLVLHAVEEPIEVPLPSGIILKGYIDRVFRDPGDPLAYHVLDIKTGTKRPSSALQLGFYQVGYEAKYPGVRVDSGAWWMAKDAKEFVVPIDHVTIEALDEYAKAYYRGVEQEVFIPNAGDACFFCSFKQACHAYPKG
jgi:putative RecB family exonuclease